MFTPFPSLFKRLSFIQHISYRMSDKYNDEVLFQIFNNEEHMTKKKLFHIDIL